MISKLHLKNETNLAGFILFLGTFCILITIGFEYTIGWIGVKRSANEIPLFIYGVWDDLKHIWAWQIFGFSLQCIAYILFLKNATQAFKSLLWATLMVLSLFIIIGFGICLGGYYPALEVYEQQPHLFQEEFPEEFQVDVSALDVGDAIHVRDMILPASIELLTDRDLPVVSVVAPVVVEEEVVEEEVDEDAVAEEGEAGEAADGDDAPAAEGAE